jgi:regulator of cell morphogenesis and NO signaling
MLKESNTYLTDEIRLADALESMPGLIPVIDRFEIPLGFSNNTIKEICDKYSINKETFLFVANLYITGRTYNEDWIDEYGLPDLLRYLKRSHNEYSGQFYPEIKKLVYQVQSQNDDPGVRMVGLFYEEYMNEVKEHLRYEDEIVFPYINALIKGNNTYELNFSVQEYKEHHDDIEEKLGDLKNLLIRYLPVQQDGPTRRKLLEQLYLLEYDLHIHSLIEDSVLIPIVEKLEKENRKHEQ